jgi:hypothetical protein
MPRSEGLELFTFSGSRCGPAWPPEWKDPNFKTAGLRIDALLERSGKGRSEYQRMQVSSRLYFLALLQP